MPSNKGFTITNTVSSWNWSLPSLYSQGAILLHFYETALNVAQHWPIAAILWIALRRHWIQEKARMNEFVLDTEKKQRGTYKRASPSYACLTCSSCAESCMTSADSASALLCSFTRWPCQANKKVQNYIKWTTNCQFWEKRTQSNTISWNFS